MIVQQSKDGTSYPVSLDDMKVHVRVDGTDEDSYIQGLILAGRDLIEKETGKDLTDSTYDAYLAEFPGTDTPIELTKQTVSSVSYIKYFDGTNQEQTLDSTSYHVQTPTVTPAWVEPVSTASWPTTYERPDAVNIRYVCSADCPQIAKHCLKLLVAHWYENREGVSEGKVSEIPFGIERLLDQLRVSNYR